jgi:hypothetical protein
MENTGRQYFGQHLPENIPCFPSISLCTPKNEERDNYLKFVFLSLSRLIPLFPDSYATNPKAPGSTPGGRAKKSKNLDNPIF